MVLTMPNVAAQTDILAVMFRQLSYSLANDRRSPEALAQALWEAARGVWLAQVAGVVLVAPLVWWFGGPARPELAISFAIAFVVVVVALFAIVLIALGRGFAASPRFVSALRSAIILGSVSSVPVVLALVLAILAGFSWLVGLLAVLGVVLLWFSRARLVLMAIDVEPEPEQDDDFPLLR
jgi:hypothetical protein